MSSQCVLIFSGLKCISRSLLRRSPRGLKLLSSTCGGVVFDRLLLPSLRRGFLGLHILAPSLGFAKHGHAVANVIEEDGEDHVLRSDGC